MNAIEIRNLVKTYNDGKVEALKGIDLTVEKGDFFALLGANGAGKTTTIGILTGLVNKTSGSCEIFGKNLDKDFLLAKREIGLVPQEFNFNMFEKTLDIVLQQAGYFGLSVKEAMPYAKELLDRLGLNDKADKAAQTLSGGLKRRLMIARALIHKPKLLFLDEPTAGVDVELRVQMWDFLRDLNEKEDVTILLTTHYLEEAEQLCNNVAMIKKGEIVMNGTVKNLLRSLDFEMYVADVPSKKVPQDLKLDGYDVDVVDESTIEIRVPKAKSMNDLLREMSDAGIEVDSIRPKGNRLESLFLNVLHDK